MDEEELQRSIPTLNTENQEPNDESGHESILIIGSTIVLMLILVYLIQRKNSLRRFFGIGATENVEQTGDIFKLDIDCYEEVFDYLPFKDLVSVGKTCKRLQQMAGYCCQQNYLWRASCTASGIKCGTSKCSFNVAHFAPYIENIKIYEDGLQYFLDTRSKFWRLKKIEIVDLKNVDMIRLKRIPMSNIESLSLDGCDLSDNFNEIIDHCPKLRSLDIQYCEGDYKWLNCKYPSLEFLELFTCGNKSIEGIPKFLELNPNIESFSTTARWFWENRDKIMNFNIKLFSLWIRMDDERTFENLGPMVDLLNEFHDRGFYSRFHLYFGHNEQMNIDHMTITQLARLNGLVDLFLHDFENLLAFSALKNLEELYVDYSERVADLEMLPNELINLESISFYEASIDDIVPFIIQSVGMQEIKVYVLRSGVHFNEDTGIIDLLALNRVRELLPNASKITLTVEESIYLATKWAMKGNDFRFIRLKRKTIDGAIPNDTVDSFYKHILRRTVSIVRNINIFRS